MTILQPDGQPINQAILSIALNNLNSKRLRRGGKLTSSEIHTSRDAWSKTNLSLDDSLIHKNQHETREKNNLYHNKKVPEPEEAPASVGDIVHLNKKPGDKHQIRDTYIVTGHSDEKINIQKICSKMVK